MGFIRAGLAQVSVLSSVVFAGISGSALADIGGIGRIEIDAEFSLVDLPAGMPKEIFRDLQKDDDQPFTPSDLDGVRPDEVAESREANQAIEKPSTMLPASPMKVR